LCPIAGRIEGFKIAARQLLPALGRALVDPEREPRVAVPVRGNAGQHDNRERLRDGGWRSDERGLWTGSPVPTRRVWALEWAQVPIPNLSIHYGQFRTRPTQMRLAEPRRTGPKTVRVLKTEEKGSDVNLASYLLLDAFRNDCEVAVVVSNDADLKMPIELTMDELGVRVGVLNPHPPERRSLDLHPTFLKQLRQGPIEASQFAPVLHDASGGGEIRKPKGW
jgi:hypothetical protein